MIGHDDAPHLNPPHITHEAREDIFEGMTDGERQARETGRPSLGAGAIYPVREDSFFIEPFRIPDWYEYAYSIDPGWRCTAGLVAARNPDTDQHYLVAEFYGMKDQPVVHVAGIKAMLPWPDIEGLMDPAGDNVGNMKDGTKMKEEYEDLGLELVKANNAVHSGLRHCLTMIQTGKLKAFDTLVYLKKEFRLYRRNNLGKIVKEHDHLLDDMRYIMNTEGAFQQRPIETKQTSNRRGEW